MIRSVAKTRWFFEASPDGGVRSRLFCFPYAGGGANVYFHWRSRLLSKRIGVCAIQLPGRESRFSEPAMTDIGVLVCQICDSIEQYLDKPFSLFGHSMGTLIAFEIVRELERRRLRLPEWLLVSGSVAPHRRVDESLHTLPERQFITAVTERYGGFPREVLANQDLIELVIPILKADFALIERYRFEVGATVPVKIAVFGGNADKAVPSRELLHWSDLVRNNETVHHVMFAGDHFFLNSERELVLTEVERLLA
jgi:surfactin synthase thioesterase subunit